MSNKDSGKGDKPRPVNKKKYEENYERIFAKKQAYDSIFRKTKE